MPNATLRAATCTGCTRDTKIQNLHDETQTLPPTEQYCHHNKHIGKHKNNPFNNCHKTPHQKKWQQNTASTPTKHLGI